MKVLMISTDREVFREGSDSQRRMRAYRNIVDELHIVVFSKKSLNLKDEEVAPGLFLYATNSMSRFTYMRGAFLVGSKICAERMIDLITTQDPFETGTAGVRLARAYNKKLELQIHTDFLSPYFSKDSYLNKIRVRMARKNIPLASHIRVVSQKIKDSIIEHFAGDAWKKITVLPIFTDVHGIVSHEPQIDLKKQYPQFAFIVLLASRLEQEKHIETALLAMRDIVKKHPKAGMVIVGKGSQRSKLKTQTKRLGIAWNVVFEDWQDDIISYYKTADVFFLTSSYEGYGRGLVEAAASGCPIVSTDVGIARDLLRDTEKIFLCKIGDEKCFSENAIRLIENEPLMNMTKIKLRAAAEQLSGGTWEEYLDRYKDMWDICLGK